MATSQTTKTTEKNDEAPAPWDGKTKGETYCAVCAGMVNGNGCALDTCPIRTR